MRRKNNVFSIQMEKGRREAAFLFLVPAPLWGLQGLRCALYRLLNVHRPYGTGNPVGVTDNKQAVSTPADNMDDIPIGTP